MLDTVAKSRPLDFGANTLGDCPCIIVICLRQDDDKLFTAVPRQRIGIANVGSGDADNTLEDNISALME